LQLIAPFIHAHANGFENLHSHAGHAHVVEDVFHNHAFGFDLKIHTAEFNQQEIIETPQVIGSIFKVASGVKRNLGDIDIDAVLLACVLMFAVFIRANKIQICTFDSSPYLHFFHSPHSPRAPPR
jgi:hypothetical protein